MLSLFRTARVVTAPSLALVLLAVASPASHAQARGLTWGPAPSIFPSGARMAVLSGDPARAAPYAVQLSMPNGYRVPPHWHPTDEHMVVRQGTFLLGMGDDMNPTTIKTMRALKVGESADAKATMHHYAMARGHTLVDVSGQGPFAMNYVNPADKPLRRK